MAFIKKFEDITAWQKARVLTREIYATSRKGLFSRDYGLRDQIRKASVSIMANIAEGFGREGDKEFRQFLGHAKGSASEVESHLYVALDAEFIGQDEFERLYELALETQKLIAGFIAYLNRSRIGGMKFKGRP